MKKIGILFGGENSFPGALVERINAHAFDGIQAEFVVTGARRTDQPLDYAVLIDRISHQVPFYRALLKQAALGGCIVVNNPFWASADDKYFNYTLAEKLGVAVPPTVMLPHKQLPGVTTDKSLRNLEFPLDWESVFAHVGEHGFLKPIDGGGGADVTEVHNRTEFFQAYDQSRDLCMVYQRAVPYSHYFRCYVVGQKQVRVMPYDPRLPHAERYIGGEPEVSGKVVQLMKRDAVKLCRALGYDFNTVEFGIENGIPYAIDFMNPVPDADMHSIGAANFAWVVDAVADFAIAKAKAAPLVPELRAMTLLTAQSSPMKKVKKKPARSKSKLKTPAK